MQPEIGGLATRGAAGGASIAGIQANPENYIGWFDVVRSLHVPGIDAVFYTYGDVTEFISALVGVAVILSTVKALFGVKAMRATLISILAICMLAALSGCAIQAEKERPEDVSGIRASYTKVSAVQSLFVGGTIICQLTILDGEEYFQSLIDSYSVVLDEDGCAIFSKDE